MHGGGFLCIALGVSGGSALIVHCALDMVCAV
jgi:hypothetical protein